MAGTDLVTSATYAFFVAVAEGRKVTPEVLAERLASREQKASLSVREHEILVRIFRRQSNREVALALKLADKTVEMYITSLLAKLGAKSRTEAVAIALERGLL